jgi:hypothetical protein
MSKMNVYSMVNGFKSIINKANGDAEYFGKKFKVIKLTSNEVTIEFNGIVSTITLSNDLQIAVSLYKVGFTIFGNDPHVRTVLSVHHKVSKVAKGYGGTHLYKWLAERGFNESEVDCYRMANAR